MKRKLLSVLLTLCLAFSLLPTAALAEEGEAARTGDLTYTTADETISGFTYTSGTITINAENVTVENVTFGDGARLEVNTPGRFTLKNCTFNGKTEVRTPVTLNVGSATVTGNTFNGTKEDGTPSYYNAIEFAVSSGNKLSSATLSNNIFEAAIKNNYFSTYYYADNAVITAENNVIKLANRGSNAIRISNVTNSNVTFNLNNNSYEFSDASGSSEYEGFIILQDFTKKSGNTEDFSKVTINISNLTSPSDASRLFYVWEDSVGLVSDNNPVIKGDSSIEKFFTAKVGDTYYKTLADAVAAAKNGGTIDLLSNVSERLWIRNNEDVTINLNGYTISSENQTANVRHGKLTVNGPGTIKEDTPYFGALLIKGSTNQSDTNYAVATINKNVTLEGWAPVFIDQLDSKNNAGKAYGITVNLNGAVLNGKKDSTGDLGSGIYVNGTIKDTTNAPVINLDSTTVTSEGQGMYLAGYATTTVNGGSVSGSETGIEIRAGKLTVNGATVNGNGIPTSVTPNGNGSTSVGAGIAVAQHTTKLPIDVTISDGTISGYTAFYESNPQNNAAEDLVKINIAVKGGEFKAINGGTNAVYSENKTGFISGGYFTSDPSAYLAASHYVWASDKDGYAYMVKDAVPTSPEQKITVIDKTDATVNNDIAVADKAAISGVISKANVDGVAEAVAPAKKADIVAKSGVTDVENNKVEIEVAVKVEAKAADLANGKLTFEASPVATVKVNGIEQAQKVHVTNDMLNGQPITVKLPLPTVDGKLFTPEQIKHTSSDGSVEYFLKTAKRGAKTFEIKDDCAVFKITKFSTFELSGVVTYVEPSYYSGSSSSDPTYSVSTPSKTEHGTVTVSPKSASKGDRVTVTVKPDSGYVLETLTVTDKNGNELTLKDKGDGKYTFTMPAGKVEVKATFMEDNSMLNFFYDVPNNAYFYEAVKWAVKNGITTGVGNDLFAPEQPCTRAQIVTFLWRAAGSPEPKGAASGMSDVVSGSYYEKAVAWAIENGITTGTTTTTFSPDATCTRAQAVTFLARALKAKTASAAEFSDVPTDSYFADAVAWAAANGVTEGIGGGLFGSDNDCTRGQIVTFLYRAYNK